MKKYFIGGGVLVLIVVLLSWGKLFGAKPLAFWNNTDIACLPNGHTNVSLHFHPELGITVDGANEQIPANIGSTAACMSEVHTHDATGKIHIEAVKAGRTYTLNDFFHVWGKDIARPDYTLTMTVDGQPNPELGDLVLKDAQKIELVYTSAAEATSTAQ